MFSALIAIVISLVTGGVLWYLTQRSTSDFKITGQEFALGAAVSTIFLLLFAPITENVILNSKAKYWEYFNGYETNTTEEKIKCERDGDCVHTYACDAYVVPVTYYTYDEDGNATAHVRMETRYHDCPHLRNEYAYTIETTLGEYRVGHRYAKDRSPWRDDERVPGSIPDGPPQEWKEAKERIEAGRNGGVTKLHEYKNFLLASDQTILYSYSADIEHFKSEGLLPDHTTNYKDPIHSLYLADKFHAVGFETDNKAWNEALNRLNGYLGDELQGDVHMAAINADSVPDQDRYAQSLFAHWKDKEAFGRYAFPKNGIGVVVGVKDGVVVWARATGGLPVGNEGLFVDIRNQLVGVKFEPDALIGLPLQKTGALYGALWGEHKFERPCMECIEEQREGYNYLKSDLYITGWQRFWIVFVSMILSGGMWAAFLYADARVTEYFRDKEEPQW